MENLQQTVKITDGMLRSLVQRLSGHIDKMGAEGGHAEITSVAKQLEGSLIQVQRVREQLESTLARAAEHEHAIRQAANQAVGQQKESAESAMVTDKLSKLAAIFGATGTGGSVEGNTEGGDSDNAIGRLETKIDALAAKFVKVGEVEMKALQLDVQRVYAKVNKPRKSSAIVKAAAKPTSSVPSPQATTPPGLAGPDLKRKREDEDAGAPPLAQAPWDDDQERKLKDLTEQRETTGSVLGRLVPCPDGGLWDSDRIWNRFRLLFTASSVHEYVDRMLEFMATQKVQTWCCARLVAVDGTNTVNYAGKCKTCGYTGCVQIRRAAEDGAPLSHYYYIRVVNSPSYVR